MLSINQDCLALGVPSRSLCFPWFPSSYLLFPESLLSLFCNSFFTRFDILPCIWIAPQQDTAEFILFAKKPQGITSSRSQSLHPQCLSGPKVNAISKNDTFRVVLIKMLANTMPALIINVLNSSR